ncbi:MAG: molybdate ABC transporter substrate-binding protein, partial [Cyanobacteriota bacterium]|nr:molybdate ABC transporter substrate-binding protein [Cyanobacteriota bacterium]
GSLQQQIEQGAPVDLFISAANKQMDALEKQNLLAPGTRKILVRNQLVLITPKNETGIQKFVDLTQPSASKIALGEPKSVPAGQYGAEVLKFYNLLEVLKPKIVYAKDVRQVLTYVETGNVSAGLVYATDAKTSQKVRIVATAPKESHAPIVYPMAILRNSKNMNAAQSFAQFLVSNSSKGVFNKYGFIF